MFFLSCKKQVAFLVIGYFVFVGGCSKPDADNTDGGSHAGVPLTQDSAKGVRLGKKSPSAYARHSTSSNPSTSGGGSGNQLRKSGVASPGSTGNTTNQEQELSEEELWGLQMIVESYFVTLARALYKDISMLYRKQECFSNFSSSKYRLRSALNRINNMNVFIKKDKKAFFAGITDIDREVDNLDLTSKLLIFAEKTRQALHNGDLEGVREGASGILSVENGKKLKIIRSFEYSSWKTLAKGSLSNLHGLLQDSKSRDLLDDAFLKRKISGNEMKTLIKNLREEKKKLEQFKPSSKLKSKVEKAICKSKGDISDAMASTGDIDVMMEIQKIKHIREPLDDLTGMLFLLENGFHPRPIKALYPDVENLL
ncbi:MAG: hypothetical protein AAF320_00300 [Myxococcota bacterium]